MSKLVGLRGALMSALALASAAVPLSRAEAITVDTMTMTVDQSGANVTASFAGATGLFNARNLIA